MNATDFDGVDAVDSELALGPQRTSVLAILALICAVICIIPGTGLLAVIFGISALVGINSSRGRVGGTGLAVTGLVLGLIVTLIWAAVGIGASQALHYFTGPMMQPARQSLTAIDSGDFKNARTVLMPSVAANVTDEQLQAFRAAYQSELGSFKGIPEGWDLIASYQQLGAIMEKIQPNGMNNAIPVPASFDKGTAVLFLVIDKNAQGAGTKPGQTPQVQDVIPVQNLIMITPAGNLIELVPQQAPALTLRDQKQAGEVPGQESRKGEGEPAEEEPAGDK